MSREDTITLQYWGQYVMNTILAIFTSELHPASSHIYANCLSVFMRPGCTRIQVVSWLICTWDDHARVCVYIYIYNIHIYAYIYGPVFMCICMCMYLCVTYVYICVGVCIYVYGYFCLCVFFSGLY